MIDKRRDITRLLREWSSGDKESFDRLIPLVYDELRAIARARLRGQGRQTLNTTALVHEAYLNLVEQEGTDWRDRAHFFAVASKVMRHLLVDHARHRGARKRGGDRVRVDLDDKFVPVEERPDELLALDAALSDLGEQSPDLERVVECRFFGGMTVKETSAALDMSVRTVERNWTRARAYLYQALQPGEPDRRN